MRSALPTSAMSLRSHAHATHTDVSDADESGRWLQMSAGELMALMAGMCARARRGRRRAQEAGAVLVKGFEGGAQLAHLLLCEQVLRPPWNFLRFAARLGSTRWCHCRCR